MNEYAKGFFDQLVSQKETIEHEMGETLKWERLENNKRSQILLESLGSQLSRRDDWKRQFEWLKEKLERFHIAFSPRLKFLEQLETQ
ncbi:MAG: DUF4268 domain-containing protein [Pleurocapsa sp. SU_196_0]|nr:DUF4268 domain-containing protein [Pleurocapsa sp. SU_196_0]